MMRWAPKFVPLMIYPADWCLWCGDPGHDSMEVCNILTQRVKDGEVVVEPCGCTTNITAGGRQGDYVVRVMTLQKE